MDILFLIFLCISHKQKIQKRSHVLKILYTTISIINLKIFCFSVMILIFKFVKQKVVRLFTFFSGTVTVTSTYLLLWSLSLPAQNFHVYSPALVGRKVNSCFFSSFYQYIASHKPENQ